MTAYLHSKADIPAVITEMTLDEKLQLITTMNHTKTHAVERLGIPSICAMDGGTGPNFNHHLHDNAEKLNTSKPAPNAIRGFHRMLMHPETVPEDMKEVIDAFLAEIDENWLPDGQRPGCYPPGMLLGATWDPETVRLTGRALARECDAFKMDVILGSPNVNIHRDPRNGRLFEGYSEDPCLAATLAPELVKGVQEEGLVANIKHFAANNQETERSGVNEIISQRALREIYLPGFKACVTEGKGMTVMSAYNSINGRPCAQNPWLLKDVLKGEWGFEGAVTSDWGAVYDQVEALNSGNDLEQPHPVRIDALYAAVKSGALRMETIDEAVRRVLNVIVVSPSFNGRRHLHLDRAFSHAAGYRDVAEGAVLLKNNGVLPLRKDARVGVFGAKSKDLIFCGQGSAEVVSDQVTHVYPELVRKLGADRVLFGAVADNADAVVVTVGVNGQEGSDQPDMFLPQADRLELTEAIQAGKAKGKPVVAILNLANPVDLREYVDDLDAILCIFIPGMCGGEVTADILLGDVNPSGKLPLTFPKRYEDTPAYLSFPGESGESWYSEGIFVGYRYYDTKDVEPLYPFGHGLSYTTFSMSDLRLSSEVWNARENDTLTVRVRVTNTGKTDGKEVVQLYIHDEKSTLRKPLQELKAFKKVFVKAGESVDAELQLRCSDLASYDARLKEWVSEPGFYQVRIGSSSRNIQLIGRFRLVAHNPYAYTPYGSISQMIQDPRAVEVLKRYIPAQAVDSMVARVTAMPNITLARLWSRTIHPMLDGTREEKDAIREKAYKELGEIEVIE
ncbi:MAG: glycoside hydrolase family 3 C-terminal domain-containing protein [Clostridia bacterium]|nr:glycoside hydrolase family 3 C-terminal domain-containing protein [Clostridia bacterium]